MSHVMLDKNVLFWRNAYGNNNLFTGKPYTWANWFNDPRGTIFRVSLNMIWLFFENSGVFVKIWILLLELVYIFLETEYDRFTQFCPWHSWFINIFDPYFDTRWGYNSWSIRMLWKLDPLKANTKWVVIHLFNSVYKLEIKPGAIILDK